MPFRRMKFRDLALRNGRRIDGGWRHLYQMHGARTKLKTKLLHEAADTRFRG